jgi:hypothetical protein
MHKLLMRMAHVLISMCSMTCVLQYFCCAVVLHTAYLVSSPAVPAGLLRCMLA